MKKQVSLLFLSVMCFALGLPAKNTVVTTKSEFTTAWSAATDGDTISVAYNGGTTLNVSTVTMSLAGGCITLMSEDPDSVATLQIQVAGVTIADSLTCGLVFENLHIEYKSVDGSSGQIIYFNRVFANMSQLVFRNCEITRSVRSLFRSVTDTANYESCGDVDYFEMSNCLVHNTFLSSSHNWPLVYFGHLPVEMNFKNNTFYDMPYMKNIFTINYADAEQGRNAVINFENNTVCVSGPTAALFSTGSYLGDASEFNFKNNLLLIPNWVNDLNLSDTSYNDPKVVSAKYGIITAQNNLIEGYAKWTAGQVLDTEGEGAFTSLDTVPQYTMTDLGISWSDFTDPESGDYSYLFTSQLATAGSDGGPIGDPRWVLTYDNPRNLTVTANIEDAVVTPAKGVYENGDSITVTASDVVGYTFIAWKDTLGNVLSTENPYSFAITSDLYIVAYYEVLATRTVSVTLKGTNTATYSISPVQDTYYFGDVITITLDDHAINDFLGWSDGKEGLTRTDTLTSDLSLTASFTQYSYALAWDFCQLTANNQTFSNLAANHYSDILNTGVMNLMAADTLAPTFQTRNNKFTAGELKYCMLRKTPSAYFENPDYLFVKFSTKELTGVKVSSKIASDNCIYQVQKMQYSLNGKDYTDMAIDTLPGDTTLMGNWYDLAGELPEAAEGQDSVFVRWIADPSSTRIYVSSSNQSYEYCYISEIVVLADEDLQGASWRVNPLLDYTAGQVISSVPGITLTLGGGTNVWSTADTTLTFGDATYVANLNGTVNPVDNDGSKFSVSGNPPTVGVFYKFVVQYSDTLDVVLIINANKASYFLEDSVALADYNGFTVAAKTYASYRIPVSAGKSYYMFSQGSKMGIMGFVYNGGSGMSLKNPTMSNSIYTSSGTLFIKASQENAASVYDLMGRKVLSTKLNEGLNEISGLKKGMYLIRIGTETTKVVM